MPFQKGHKLSPGRKVGQINKATANVKAVFVEVFAYFYLKFALIAMGPTGAIFRKEAFDVVNGLAENLMWATVKCGSKWAVNIRLYVCHLIWYGGGSMKGNK